MLLEPIQEIPEDWGSPLTNWYDNLVQPRTITEEDRELREEEFQYEGQMLDEEDSRNG